MPGSGDIATEAVIGTDIKKPVRRADQGIDGLVWNTFGNGRELVVVQRIGIEAVQCSQPQHTVVYKQCTDIGRKLRFRFFVGICAIVINQQTIVGTQIKIGTVYHCTAINLRIVTLGESEMWLRGITVITEQPFIGTDPYQSLCILQEAIDYRGFRPQTDIIEQAIIRFLSGQLNGKRYLQKYK
ncbi:hypothetical protein BACCELL_05461 [Bacteroides cellulosilyticus DSM 14838]|uniref:Uncharacterized protein n=1 Tax=Bacteroides cellulosilyticus DSM 14838 TaxID=537012 RepID=E2NMB6_9BACE|nr:hypothetical protein BACCELL_05461 [Bacteroides cellulosilyticus DSM 14838]